MPKICDFCRVVCPTKRKKMPFSHKCAKKKPPESWGGFFIFIFQRLRSRCGHPRLLPSSACGSSGFYRRDPLSCKPLGFIAFFQNVRYLIVRSCASSEMWTSPSVLGRFDECTEIDHAFNETFINQTDFSFASDVFNNCFARFAPLASAEKMLTVPSSVISSSHRYVQ